MNTRIHGDARTREAIGLASLESTTETENKVECGLLLDVVVLECPSVFKLLTCEDQTLLIWRNAFLVLDLLLHGLLHGLDGIGVLYLQCDGLTSKCLDEDLHTTTEAKDEVESGLLLNVVVLEGAAIFKLLTCEDQTLLIWRNTFLVLDLLLHRLNGVSVLNFKCDSLASECFNKDLHVDCC